MSRPSLPCPRSPCLRLLLIHSASEAANMSLHRDPLQVQLDRRVRLGGLHAVSLPRGLRAPMAERASRPCCCGAALQLAGGGAGCSAAAACPGPLEPVLGGCRRPRATREPGPLRAGSRVLPEELGSGGRGTASARLPCELAPVRAPPVLWRSPCRQRRPVVECSNSAPTAF